MQAFLTFNTNLAKQLLKCSVEKSSKTITFTIWKKKHGQNLFLN